VFRSWLTRRQSSIDTGSSVVAPGVYGRSSTTRNTQPIGSRRNWASNTSSPQLSATRAAALRSRSILASGAAATSDSPRKPGSWRSERALKQKKWARAHSHYRSLPR
jgi:hypothetical protein